MKDIVQIKNPKSGKYIKIDRDKGIILSHKTTKGPYKNIPVARKKEDRDILKPDVVCRYCKYFDISMELECIIFNKNVQHDSKVCEKFELVDYFYCSACEQRISVEACVNRKSCSCENIKTCSQREILEEAYAK